MIYTTYFAAMKKLPEGVEPVSIARFLPKGIQIRSCSKFFPPESLLKRYKAKEISDDEYAEIYRKEVLLGLDAKAAGKALDGKALVCFEKTGSFCHRNLVAEWFRANGVACEEFSVDNQSLFDSNEKPEQKTEILLRYKAIRGDILSAPERYAFVCFVNKDNIALDLASARMQDAYPEMAKKVKLETGKCSGFTNANPRRSIINVVIDNDANYDSLATILYALKDVVVNHRIGFLAVPALSGKWDSQRVEYILSGVFHDVDMAVVFYYSAS